MVAWVKLYVIGEPAMQRAQDSTEITMAALITLLFIIVVISGILAGGFLAICGRIRRTDKWGNLRPETSMPHRHHMLAYASRWDDDNTPALV